MERFQPGVRRVRELGIEPRFIECHRLTRFGFRAADVGVVHDLMIHDLDLVLDLVKSEVEDLDAAGGAVLSEAVEDIASVRLVFENGARANVTASRVSLSPMRRFRMFSPSSYVSLDFTRNEGMLVRPGAGWEEGRRAVKAAGGERLLQQEDFLRGGLLDLVQLELSGREQPLQAELDAFLAAVREGRPPEVTGEDGRRAVALADRITAEIRARAW